MTLSLHVNPCERTMPNDAMLRRDAMEIREAFTFDDVLLV
jgi:hypothetical protein